MSQPLLNVADVSIQFGGTSRAGVKRATEDVSFEVRRGQSLAIVGESGSGKSVTAMAILGLLPETARVSGSITYGTRDLLTCPEREMRDIRGREIAMIFQEPMTALNPVYTIGSLMREALLSHTETARGQLREKCLSLLRDVHMPDPEEKLSAYPHQLSGGQRQRAMIAIAIAHNPDLLIADEPTTALDVTVQAEILTLLRELQNKHDMSLLLITHDMGVVADVADDVVVMEKGRVVETASALSIFRAPQEPYTKRLLEAVPRRGQARGDRAHDPVAGTAPVLVADGLTVEFKRRHGGGQFRAVDQVSFQLEAGETLGLVGESGSGKSSIGKSLAGLVKPAAGQVVVDGKPLWAGRESAKSLRGVVSVVFQDPASSLNPRTQVWRCITDPLRWMGVEKKDPVLKKTSQDLLEHVGLPADSWNRYPHELSGGQRQRVGIARAVAIRPKVLIADEPTSALDVSVQATVLKLMRELQSEYKFACLFISHDLAVVENLSDRVAVMHEGRIVELGATWRVMANPQDSYTAKLLAAAPVPDPEQQRARRSGSRDQGVISERGQ